MPLNLPTVADVNAKPRACPKGPRRLEDKATAKTDDAKQLAAWRNAVTDHDKHRDRYTGKRVIATLALDPHRQEAHHHEPRSNYDTRYDPRNGITLSLATHERVERHELRIEGDHYFTVKGRRYLDVSKPVRFVVVKS